MIIMFFDKEGVRDTVTIDKDEVIRGGGADSFIKDLIFAESFILLPDMFDREGQFGGKFFNLVN
jgi:hypothetical protein